MVNFLIIGAQKAGSSSFHRYLNLHPEISMTRTKEVNYFLDKNFKKGQAWYNSKFDDDSKLHGDCSPSYSRLHLYPEIVNNLRKFSKPLKIIYVLRNPYERIKSHLVHDQVTDRIPHKFDVLSTLKSNDDYILTSSYFFQILPYVELYGRENVYCITLEKFNSKPEVELNRIFEFLELPAISLNKDSFRAYNSSKAKRRIKFYTKIYNKLDYKIIKEPWFRFFKKFGRKTINPNMGEAELNFISKRLKKDYKSFDSLFNLGLTEWLK